MTVSLRVKLRSTWLGLAVATLALINSPQALANSQDALKGVKSEISRQQKSLGNQQKELDKLQQSLRQQELAINASEQKIRQTQQSLTATNQKITALNQRIAQLDQQREAQSAQLAELLKLYYMTQKGKAPASILGTDADEDRISQYFQHIAKARSDAIADLETTYQELNQSKQQLSAEKNQITALLEQQKKEQQTLASSQKQRKGTIGKIQKSISSDQVYLAELQRNETRLQAEIAKAAKRAAVPMDGLAKQKGKLPWPVKGKVLHRYGSKQAGQIDWKGIVIDANYGQKVNAVYPGTIVFADYLRGYGLVILLDHGKGDMTLYGFNQTLLKKEGDKVAAGEAIALAGDTGGQSQASVYFELRRNSKTYNPTSWLN
ncbi:murein hydrolase activator EnvC family protein [Vibrio astriarenae]|uniref:murein hydrolase activator EnvC family protein n=1 Tax=Vibrio astriarenae TaxID=1481923 RepID=UPI00373523E4